MTGGDISWLPEKSCDIRPVAAMWPFEGTYLTAHEMVHNFGAVPGLRTAFGRRRPRQ